MARVETYEMGAYTFARNHRTGRTARIDKRRLARKMGVTHGMSGDDVRHLDAILGCSSNAEVGGLFSKIKKGVKKVAKGVKTVAKKTVKAVVKVAKSKVGRIVYKALPAVLAVIPGAQGAAAAVAAAQIAAKMAAKAAKGGKQAAAELGIVKALKSRDDEAYTKAIKAGERVGVRNFDGNLQKLGKSQLARASKKKRKQVEAIARRDGAQIRRAGKETKKVLEGREGRERIRRRNRRKRHAAEDAAAKRAAAGKPARKPVKRAEPQSAKASRRRGGSKRKGKTRAAKNDSKKFVVIAPSGRRHEFARTTVRKGR